MFCRDCGEKLTLGFVENEGLVPYCPKCEKFKFPFFPVAVSMTVVNKDESKILLARHVGDEDYKLFAGYIKKGENAEKAIPREIREETNLTAIKWRYFCSRYHDAKNLLMLNFVVTVNEGEMKLGEEIDEVKWCTPEEAKALIRKNSTAEYFLNGVLPELGKKR
ncbi:MAG: NUDIX domain-containing protein [Clostridia bacterium]|nr:NUDIX domain-containing protein [Clostridia bacterium]